jgi:hypothetical protein
VGVEDDIRIFVMTLLTVGNPKLLKGQAQGYLSSVLHLAPYTLSGKNTCPKATPGCAAACLNTAGRGGIMKKGESTNVIQQARIRKTKAFFENRTEFMSKLLKDINNTIKYAEKKGLTPVFRLNGTSDLAWEKYEILEGRNIFQMFPDVQFYDYTKIVGRKVSHIKNYHLTFSNADGNINDVLKAKAAGMNIAVVFRKELPKQYLGMPVINGDDTDLRFLDPKGVIVGLKAKGKAKKDESGFVV